MQAIDDYRLEAHDGPYAQWPSTSRLWFRGAFTGTRVPGYRIEAQYRSPAGVLLITSFDCPYEEANIFVLLDDAHRVLARAALQTAFASHLLNAHWPTGPQSLALFYDRDRFMTLTLEPRSGWRRGRVQLTLREVLHWQHDVRMRDAHAQHHAQLQRIAQGLADDAAMSAPAESGEGPIPPAATRERG